MVSHISLLSSPKGKRKKNCSIFILENIQEQPNGKELDSRTNSEVAVGVTTRTSVFQG